MVPLITWALFLINVGTGHVSELPATSGEHCKQIEKHVLQERLKAYDHKTGPIQAVSTMCLVRK